MKPRHDAMDTDVPSQLRELAEVTRDRLPSPHVEAALMRAFAQQATAPRPRVAWIPAFAASAALAAVVAVLVLLVRDVPRPASVAVVAVSLPDGFVEVPGAAALPRLDSARIVRYELPLAALPAYGIDVLRYPTSIVEADLVIGQDGYARAIRVIN